jgi:hypothetical protein
VYRDPSIAGSWDDLTRRIHRTDALPRWARREELLQPLLSVDDLFVALRPGGDKDRADEILGCLVRLAARDGGDDELAALLVLHLLSDGVLAMARRLRDLGPDIVHLIVGELAAQIRGFPWRRRTRAFAANLLLDTKAAVWRELGHRRSAGHGPRELPVDPQDAAVASAIDRSVPGPYDDGEALRDVMAWLARRGVADERDLRLLLELEHERGYGRAAEAQVAARQGMSDRTLRRRRSRALAAARAARPSYLSALA